ncbi:MAG: FAD-binding oxidoreductase [Bacteroidales bacterium]
MKNQKVQILTIEQVTHDVKSFRLQKPEGLTFEPGQATEISIDREGWRNEGRPFTFTSLPEDDYLEFTIKRYPSRKGVTNELHLLDEGDTVILNDIFGDIRYKGKGLFIAGGAGITPFLSILRQLKRNGELDGNSLLFANKTSADIIRKDELKEMLGSHVTHILSDEKSDEHLSGFITRELIVDHISMPGEYIYVCGPPPMMEGVLDFLSTLEIPGELIVSDEF